MMAVFVMAYRKGLINRNPFRSSSEDSDDESVTSGDSSDSPDDDSEKIPQSKGSCFDDSISNLQSQSRGSKTDRGSSSCLNKSDSLKNQHVIEQNVVHKGPVNIHLSDKKIPKGVKFDSDNNSSHHGGKMKISLDSTQRSAHSGLVKDKSQLHRSSKQNNAPDTFSHNENSLYKLTFKHVNKDVPGVSPQIEIHVDNFYGDKRLCSNQIEETVKEHSHAIQMDDTEKSSDTTVFKKNGLEEPNEEKGSQLSKSLDRTDGTQTYQERHFHPNHPKFHTEESVARSFLKVYTCIHCKKLLPTEFEAKYHLLSYHNMTQMCEQCGCSIQTSSELLTHQVHDYCSYQHKQRTVCGKMYTNTADMLKHVLNDHKSSEEHKSQCSKPAQSQPLNRTELFQSTSTFKEKMQRELVHVGEHERDVIFEKCKDERLDRIEARRPRKLIKEKEKKEFQCYKCDREMSSACTLRLHLYYCHILPNIEKKFQCKQCNTTLETKDDLRKHHKLHDQLKTWLCKHCGKVFKNNCHKINHERSHVKPYPCPHCSKSFAHLEYYKWHVAAHKGIKQFNCQVCGKGFFNKEYLKLHQYVHENGGRKPFSCQDCNAEFMTIHGLRKHILRHIGEKKYSCSYCNLSFYQEYDMKRHTLRHTRPKMCEMCGKSFDTEYRLKRHKHRVHKIELVKNVSRGIQLIPTP